MNKVRIATLAEIDSPTPAHALVADVDLDSKAPSGSVGTPLLEVLSNPGTQR